MNIFTYAEIAHLLEKHDADLDAAEAHGIATGMLCLDGRVPAETWLMDLFEQTPLFSIDEQEALVALFEKTRTLMLADNFEFDLFLPDGDTMLSHQLDALCSWCRGFLYGVGHSAKIATWPGDSGEILKDIIEFTKLDTQTYSEDAEKDLMEIHEYLRAAVMLLRDDLRGNNVQLH